MRYLLLLLPFIIACGDYDPAARSATSNLPIVPWHKDSMVFSWGGREPILLLGAGNAADAFLDPDYEQKLKLLTGSGGNLVLLDFEAERVRQKKYRDSLVSYLNLCRAERVAVRIQIIGDFSSHQSEVLELLKPYQDITLSESSRFQCADNARSAFEFNQAVLNGAVAVRHAARPYGLGFSGAALASIRAVRTIEQHVKFWDLRPSPEILPETKSREAIAATNGQNTYVIYLPTAGEVKLSLGLDPQIPLRVIVVGYLGTQKSEILQPPYGDAFSLYTEEPRGGWMVIKPL